MKQFKEAIINLIILILGLYLPFAFILNIYNPINWVWYERILYVIGLFVIIISLTNKGLNNK